MWFLLFFSAIILSVLFESYLNKKHVSWRCFFICFFKCLNVLQPLFMNHGSYYKKWQRNFSTLLCCQIKTHHIITFSLLHLKRLSRVSISALDQWLGGHFRSDFYSHRPLGNCNGRGGGRFRLGGTSRVQWQLRKW